jgi:hypothetical protein
MCLSTIHPSLHIYLYIFTSVSKCLHFYLHLYPHTRIYLSIYAYLYKIIIYLYFYISACLSLYGLTDLTQLKMYSDARKIFCLKLSYFLPMFRSNFFITVELFFTHNTELYKLTKILGKVTSILHLKNYTFGFQKCEMNAS